MSSRFVFASGMQRSGTTLLDKLLSTHPQILLLSQPTPLIYTDVKRRFLDRRNLPGDSYPLSNLFLETGYTSDELAAFLDEEPLSRERLAELFLEMEDYSGQMTKIPRELVEELSESCAPGTFAESLKCIYSRLGRESKAALIGAKETLCEEFLPYLLQRGFFGILVVRDPRDVLTSLNYGKGRRFGGSVKPTLFNLRNWRKSIAFAIRLETHPRFILIRYEDLVREPNRQLDQLGQRLSIERFPEDLLGRKLLDQRGRTWSANSSHETYRTVSTASLGAYRERLPAPVARYAEAICYPELLWLGYPLSISAQEVPEAIRSFQDPFELDRHELAGYLAPERTSEELERWRLLHGEPGVDTARYFLFPEAQLRLAEQLVAPP